MEIDFSREVEAALLALRNGQVILYPTDTIWGLGCDATNEAAIREIYRIKQRDDSKSLIILVADERDILQYVAAPDPAVFDFIEGQTKPTTVIFDGAINLPDALVAEDGSIAIRIVQDEFCRHLVRRLRKPLVSTSANISGQPSPRFYDEISEAVKAQVDYIAKWRQDDKTPSQPSQIIRWKGNGEFDYIRK
ncbi:L-threonylcarbamoyladenylate synthase [Flavisolibacter nicotianae]|uniref:L-threonylcarbamoyladenylate synthase n=1 Tax=Flavisolibacter nicotianae TaxID=2364882 RepID=UPI000EADFEF5|nr:L-threonylcarbamoyladenylate synthase [Flavisolibacter nicotianae]